MDRDFIDHTRNGQVGFIVLRFLCHDDGQPLGVTTESSSEELILAAAALVDEAIRQNDVTYVSGPCELSILLPGASKPEAAMAADRIRAHLAAAWQSAALGIDTIPTDRPALRLLGGVSAGRHEDPQRLAERALDALDEAAAIGINAIVTDLGA